MAFPLDVLPVFGVLGVMIVTTELPSSVRLELPSSVRLELESRGSVGRNPSPPGDGATVAKDPLWGVIRSGEARSIIPAYSLVNPPGGFPILGLEYATPRVPRVILRSSTPAQTLRLHFNRKPIVSRESTFYLYEVKVESRSSRKLNPALDKTTATGDSTLLIGFSVSDLRYPSPSQIHGTSSRFSWTS